MTDLEKLEARIEAVDTAIASLPGEGYNYEKWDSDE